MAQPESPKAIVDARSLEALESKDWQNEQIYLSSELVIVRGFFGERQTGVISSSFIVEREILPSETEFAEKKRRVHLSSISVWPALWRRGLGTAMLTELERVAKNFGASEIGGTIAGADLLTTTEGLVAFYTKAGFSIEESNSGTRIVKKL